MAEHFGFFDAVQDVNGTYDREYNAEQFTIPFDALITNGVVRSAYEQLEVVTSGSNMVSQIKSGIAFIEGHHYLNDGIVELTHDVEALGMNRIDRVVIRKDSNPESRYVKAFIRKGLPSTNPVPPTLTRNEFVYEISLAQVHVVGGQGFISNIADERGTVNIGPWAGSDILPSYDDNLLAQHVNNGNIHVTQADKVKLNKAILNDAPTQLISGELKVKKGPSSHIEPTGVWMQKVVNGVDAPAEHGLSVTTRYGVSASTILEAATLWSGGEEKYTPILTVRGDKVVSVNGILLVDGVDLKQSVSNGKAAIANAVTQRGVPTAANAEFATMAANILKLTGFATGSRTVGQGGALSIDSLTFEPKVVIGVNQNTGKHLYFERLSATALGYVLSVHDYGLPDGAVGDTQATVRRRSAVAVTATSISIPVHEAGTYTYYVYG